MNLYNLMPLFFEAVSGQELYDIMWTGIRRLQNIGLVVVVVVADGASNNRKFFNIHKDSGIMNGGVVYKVKNISDLKNYPL